MKAALLFVAACLAALALLPATAAQASATLSGMNQVPTSINTATEGAWNATLAGDRMEWTLEVMDANRMTMAHIHMGDAATNGPVIVFLVPVGVGSAATTQQLPMLEPPESGDLVYRGSFTAADIAPMAGRGLGDLIRLFEEGNAYVNVHNVENPAGVVRGQVEWSA